MTVSSTNSDGKNEYPYCKEIAHLTPYAKINSKWIKSLNVSNENVKPFEESVEENLLTLVLAMSSSIWYQKHRQQKQE